MHQDRVDIIENRRVQIKYCAIEMVEPTGKLKTSGEECRLAVWTSTSDGINSRHKISVSQNRNAVGRKIYPGNGHRKVSDEYGDIDWRKPSEDQLSFDRSIDRVEGDIA